MHTKTHNINQIEPVFLILKESAIMVIKKQYCLHIIKLEINKFQLHNLHNMHMLPKLHHKYSLRVFGFITCLAQYTVDITHVINL